MRIAFGGFLAVLLFILLLGVLLNAQQVRADSQEWSRTYGTYGGFAYALISTSDGGYALTGKTGTNAWLVKTDANGTEQWNGTYGGIGRLCLCPDSDS
jgi:hypothetical protein